MNNVKNAAVALLVLALITAFLVLFGERIAKTVLFGPSEKPVYEGLTGKDVQDTAGGGSESLNVETVAENLEIPWETLLLPNGDLLVSERPGRIVRIASDGSRTAVTVPIAHRGESGLLGMALHPDFATNQGLYVYETQPAGDALRNRVMRYQYDEDALTDPVVIIDGIPGAIYHDGGRMKFGPDGFLYVTTGDATDANLAQDKNSLAGKILRLRDDGSIPDDNPFGSAVWSYGHRNPQGLAWDENGRLWSTEHGRSGIQSGYDELNLIEKGKNYGWPVIEGPETSEGMVAPVIQSTASITWAPASAAYWNHRILFGGLRGESLYEADLRTDPPTLRQHFHGEYGRIRNAAVSPDGRFLYITTSNRDGRGIVSSGDDSIIRIPLSLFE
jgi:glucose/arabinose dehydrogenase